jgi:hypothetical protein
VRIVNRLIAYLERNNMEFSQFIDELVVTQIVKTKSSNVEVEIFMAKKFFNKLQNLQIRKSTEICENLS